MRRNGKKTKSVGVSRNNSEKVVPNPPATPAPGLHPEVLATRWEVKRQFVT
jgi:hypothetical protein